MANENDDNIDATRKATEATKDAAKTTKMFGDFLEDILDRNKTAKEKLEKLNKELDIGKKRLIDIGPALDDLREAVRKEQDVRKKAEAQQGLEIKEAQYRREVLKKAVVDTAGVLVGSAISAQRLLCLIGATLSINAP